MSGSESWRTYGPSPLSLILRSALKCFAEHGYEGTSVRDIAAGAGLSVPGLYHHYPSKREILASLMRAVLDDLLARSRAALDASGPRAIDRFETLCECLMLFHMFRQQEAFVASTELRSLDPDSRASCVCRRDEEQRLIAEAIRAGCVDGSFATPYPDDAARAVSTLCVGIASWYRADGALDPDELVRRHLILLRGLVQAR